jgi:hypothetical protein
MTGPLKTVPCKRCGRWIAWVATSTGNRMPLDPEPNEAGNVFVVARHDGPLGTVARKDKPRPPGVAFVPHFATCPELNKGRKPKAEKPAKPPKPEPPPALELDI